MSYLEAYKFINDRLKARTVEVSAVSNQENYDPDVKEESCESFTELLSCLGEVLHLDRGHETVFATMLAGNIALRLGDRPLWMYVIGPPSSGKTTLADCIAGGFPYCYSISKLTGVFSGFKTVGSKDSSLIPHFMNKQVIIKDFTTVMGLPPGVQENLFGELRDLYDGHAQTRYRNGLSQNYRSINFGILACVTDAIRQYNRTGLGERFLQVEIDSWWDAKGNLHRYPETGKIIVRRAINNMISSVCFPDANDHALLSQKGRSWGYMTYLRNRMEEEKDWLPKVAHRFLSDKDFEAFIESLALWVSYARANVDRDRTKELSFRPRPELGARLSKQLVKMAIALSLVIQSDAPCDRVYEIVKKVALDTAIGFQLEVMMALAKAGDKGLSKVDLDRTIQISRTSVTNRISDLREIKAITETKSGIKTIGRPALNYRLNDELLVAAKTLNFVGD